MDSWDQFPIADGASEWDQFPAASDAADTGQGLASSALSSAGRGALSIVPGVVGGAGYLTGIEALTKAANDIEAGINEALPINPIYADTWTVKGAGAIGNAAGFMLTGGVGGAAGKALAGARGVRAGAEASSLGSGFLSGVRGGAQDAGQYGMEGETAYFRAVLGGVAEAASEKLLFGLGTETAAARKLLGESVEGRWFNPITSAYSEAGEEAAAALAGNIANTALAPAGVQTPGITSGVAESAALGAIAGGFMGGINMVTGPEPASTTPSALPSSITAPQPEPDLEPVTRHELGGKTFIRENGVWLRPLTKPELATATPNANGTYDLFVPLDPANDVDGALIPQLEVTARAKLRAEAKAATAPTISPDLGAPDAVSSDSQNVDPPIFIASTPPARLPEGKETESELSTAPASVSAASGQPSKRKIDTLTDPTGTDLVSIIQGERLRLGQPNESAEWEWYRQLEKEAAASPLKKQSAEAAARRGEVDDPAALKAWVDLNILGGSNKPENVAQTLNDSFSQSLDATSLGPTILATVEARRLAREQGGTDDAMSKLEAETVERERQQSRDFLLSAYQSDAPLRTGADLAATAPEGSTVQINGKPFEVEQVDAEAGSLWLRDPSGVLGSQMITAEDSIPIEGVTAPEINEPFSLAPVTERRSLPADPIAATTSVQAAITRSTGLARLDPTRIEIIHDPVARDARSGRGWKAKVEDGKITLNAAFIKDETDAVWNLEHELAHEVYRSREPKTTQAWTRLSSAIAANPDIRTQVESLGYTGDQVTEEQAVRLAQKLDAQGPWSEAWAALKQAVSDFLRGQWGGMTSRAVDRISAALAARYIMAEARARAGIAGQSNASTPDVRYSIAPRATGYLGAVSETGSAQVKSADLATDTHESQGLDPRNDGRGTFRYRKDNETLYWHFPPNDMQKGAAIAALERRGFKVRRSMVISFGSEESLLAHGLDSANQARYSLADDQPTTGQAQPLSSPVSTPHGWRRMGSMQPGRGIISHDGRPSIVTGIYPQGIKPVNRLMLADGRHTRITDDHLWLARVNGSQAVMTTLEIRERMDLGQVVEIPVLG